MLYNNKKIYEDSPEAGNIYRKSYVEGVNEYIRKLNETGKKVREEFMSPEKLKSDSVFFREKYRQMIGLDKIDSKDCPPVEALYVAEDDICKIYRLTVHITKEIPFYAMLMIPHGVKKAPLIIAQHGGGGTPEACSDMYGPNNYNHMVQRVLKRGAVVIAPQLMLWYQTTKDNFTACEVPYDRKHIDVNLKRFGLSITALEIKGIMNCIDYGITLKQVNSEKIGMIGLSYGGYFTLHTMAADLRIKAGFSAGCFNDRDVYSWADWCYKDAGLLFQDAEVVGLCAPRKLYIAVGEKDGVFDYHSAIEEAHRIQAYYRTYECEHNLVFNVWEGGHTIPDTEDGYEFLFSALEKVSTE